MRLFDLFTEAPIYRNYGVKTAIDPNTLSVISAKKQYDKEVAKVKADNKPETAKKDVVTVGSGGIILPVDQVQHWIKTRDTDWAFKRARKWRASRMPQEVIDSITSDPTWKKLIVGFWDLSAKYLEAKKFTTKGSYRGSPGSAVNLADVGVDPGLPSKLYRALNLLIRDHAAKFGYDTRGLRDPTLSRSVKEEQIDEKKKKPKPTSPEKWAQAKAKARSKFEVYPSAYANAWAAKEYKRMGGGWRMGE